jgi:hypothetical protein
MLLVWLNISVRWACLLLRRYGFSCFLVSLEFFISWHWCFKNWTCFVTVFDLWESLQVPFGKIVRCPSCQIAVAVAQPQQGIQVFITPLSVHNIILLV